MSTWSSEKIKQLTDLAADPSLSAADIGKIMGISRNAIIGKLDRLHLRRKKLPPHQNKYNPPTYSAHKAYCIEAEEEHRKRCERELKLPPIKPGLMIGDLKRRQCVYPYGDGPYNFCGRSTNEHSSYCEAHHKLTHSKQKKKKQLEVPADKDVIIKQSY